MTDRLSEAAREFIEHLFERIFSPVDILVLLGSLVLFMRGRGWLAISLLVGGFIASKFIEHRLGR